MKVLSIAAWLIAGMLFNLWNIYPIFSQHTLRDILPPTEMFVLAFNIGMFGSILYCMRGLYINYCVEKKPMNEWYIWYILRPFVGAGRGVVGFTLIFWIVSLFFSEVMLLGLLPIYIICGDIGFDTTQYND